MQNVGVSKRHMEQVEEENSICIWYTCKCCGKEYTMTEVKSRMERKDEQ